MARAPAPAPDRRCLSSPMTASPSASLTFPFDRPPPPGEAREVAPGVWWLRMPLPFALDHINLWLLQEADGFALVDCGYGDAPTRALWETHFAGTLGGKPITRIFATHYHPDHLGNAAWLAERFGCPVTMTLAEYLTAHAVRSAYAGHAADDMSALFRRHGIADEHGAAMSARGNRYARGVPGLPNSFHRVLDGERLNLGPARWEVVEGFGHSPEHASLHAHSLGLLISGDMLLPRISTNITVWASEPDGDPLGRFLASIARLTRLPDDTLVLPSHGQPFRGIAARVAQLQSHHADRLADVKDAIRRAGAPVSAADVVPLLFRRELDLQQRFFAMGEAIAHLNHLWHEGALARSNGAGGAVRFSLS
jgi:glyoxylase-like metal-dependent hydrolase (beta-lactamase superfamily II)